MRYLKPWTTFMMVLLGSPAFASAQQSLGSCGQHMMSGGCYGIFFGPLMMIVFFVVIIGLVVLMVRWIVSDRYRSAPHGQSPDKDSFES